MDTTSTAQDTGQSERTRRVRLLWRTGYAHYDAGEPARNGEPTRLERGYRMV